MSQTSLAVVTIASGRHDHLRRQREGLARNTLSAGQHVVVAIDDPAVPGLLDDCPAGPPAVVEQFHGAGRLALAAARNRGADVAIGSGAEVLVFLDLDCIPGPALLERYACAVRAATDPALFSGPVAYLPPPGPGGYDLPSLPSLAPGHPARPVPAEDEIIPGGEHRLFWSLSFAVPTPTWQRIGGFCESYDGYGAEDTDFGQLAARGGVGHTWVGGAWAYHQHHPTSDPPVQHLHDIVRNANTFFGRWGWWPMQGWLTAFEELGLAHLHRSGDHWTVALPAGDAAGPARAHAGQDSIGYSSEGFSCPQTQS